MSHSFQLSEQKGSTFVQVYVNVKFCDLTSSSPDHHFSLLLNMQEIVEFQHLSFPTPSQK